MTFYPRSPIVALVLSFSATGLGQIYNGDMARGCFLALVRLFLLVFPLSFSFLYPAVSALHVVIVSVVFGILAFVYAATDSVVNAFKKKEYCYKRYNRIVLYLIYFIAVRAVLSAALFSFAAGFGLQRIYSPMMAPSFEQNEYVLINRTTHRFAKSDVLLVHVSGYNVLYRVIALSRDLVQYSDGLAINGLAVKHGIVSDADCLSRHVVDTEDLYSEQNDEHTYMVRMRIPTIPSALKKFSAVPDTSFFVATDRRDESAAYLLIDKRSAAGRVEGIVFSRNISRIGLRPHL